MGGGLGGNGLGIERTNDDEWGTGVFVVALRRLRGVKGYIISDDGCYFVKKRVV